jgi:hypothetical protein
MSASNHKREQQTNSSAVCHCIAHRPWLARMGWARLLARAILLLTLVLSTLTACDRTTPLPSPVATDGSIALLLVSGSAWVQRVGGGDWVQEQGSFTLSFDHKVRTQDENAELELADGSILRLLQSSEMQIVRTSQSDERPVFRLLKGTLEVVACSTSFLVDTNRTISVAFTMRTLSMTITPLEPGTVFRLWLEEELSSLSVDTGRVEVTSRDQHATLSTGEQASVDANQELQVITVPTATPTTATPGTPTLPPGVTPTNTLTPTPKVTPTPAPTPTPTSLPVLYPAPALVQINDGAVVHLGSEFTLSWQPIENLDSRDWYEVQVWQGDAEPQGVHWTRDNFWAVDKDAYPLGSYHWRVIVVRRDGETRLGEVSPPSETRTFHVEPVPPPPTKRPEPTKPPPPPTSPPPPPDTPVPTPS